VRVRRRRRPRLDHDRGYRVYAPTGPTVGFSGEYGDHERGRESVSERTNDARAPEMIKKHTTEPVEVVRKPPVVSGPGDRVTRSIRPTRFRTSSRNPRRNFGPAAVRSHTPRVDVIRLLRSLDCYYCYYFRVRETPAGDRRRVYLRAERARPIRAATFSREIKENI